MCKVSCTFCACQRCTKVADALCLRTQWTTCFATIGSLQHACFVNGCFTYCFCGFCALVDRFVLRNALTKTRVKDYVKRTLLHISFFNYMPWTWYVKRVSLSMHLMEGTCSSIRISFLYHVHIFHIAPQLDLCIDGAVFARGLHAHDAVDTYVKPPCC